MQMNRGNFEPRAWRKSHFRFCIVVASEIGASINNRIRYEMWILSRISIGVHANNEYFFLSGIRWQSKATTCGLRGCKNDAEAKPFYVIIGNIFHRSNYYNELERRNNKSVFIETFRVIGGILSFRRHRTHYFTASDHLCIIMEGENATRTGRNNNKLVKSFVIRIYVLIQNWYFSKHFYCCFSA